MDRDDLDRKLESYFDAERAELRAPADLWANVSAQLGEQEPAPWWRRMLGSAPQGIGRAYDGAAAALALLVVGAIMYTTVIDTGSGPSESFAADSASTTATVFSMAAAAPAAPPTAAPAMAPESAAIAPAAAAMDATTMGDSVPRAPAGTTTNASAMAQADEAPFRLDVWGLKGGARNHLFWVALPVGWQSGASTYMNGVWSGTFSGPDVMLRYTFGERAQTEMLRANTRSQAAAEQRMWDEYVIGNLAFIVAPPEGRIGDLLMTLQLPTGTLRLNGEGLAPEQQAWALMILRSIIA